MDTSETTQTDEQTKAEVWRVLRADTTQFGEAFRLLETNPSVTPAEMVEQSHIANSGAASNLRQCVKAFRDGVVPVSPSIARQAAARGRSLAQQEMSNEARTYLQGVVVRLSAAAVDPARNIEEDERIQRLTAEATDSPATAGSDREAVYVYTFPQYRKFPLVTNQGDERMWLKVGYTKRQALVRVIEQVRKTGMPEDPELLRVYQDPTGSLAGVEEHFHKVLTAFGHRRADGRATGKEWFLTSLDSLDTLASALKLETVVSADTDTTHELNPQL